MNLDGAIVAIGFIDSDLSNIADALHQPVDSGAASARLVIEAVYLGGVAGIAIGDHILVVTWLHLARRDLLVVHPRDDTTRPKTSVFATRFPHLQIRSESIRPPSPRSQPMASS